jgi:hypothetical protein
VTSLVFQVTADGVYHVFDGTSNGTIHQTYWHGYPLTTYQLANVSAPITSISTQTT